jgi:hypothetical protein
MAFDRSSRYEAADAAADVNADLGRAYIEPGSEGAVTILDAERVAALKAWVETLIPGDDEWPSAGDVPAVAYIDRTIALAPRLRPVVLGAIDDVRADSVRRYQEDFAVLSFQRRVEVLRWFEDRAPLAFTLVKELAYEVYYRDKEVAKAIERRTGFNTRLPVEGLEMERYDRALELLADVAERPSLVRGVPM